MKFYTIGYGGRAPTEFMSLLVQHGVRSVADVRIHPDRASMGSYVKARTTDKGIEKLLSDQGIAYRSLLELGNMFRDFDDWRPSYRASSSGLEVYWLPGLRRCPSRSACCAPKSACRTATGWSSPIFWWQPTVGLSNISSDRKTARPR